MGAFTISSLGFLESHLAMTRLTRLRQTPFHHDRDLDQFTLHGGCVFFLVVVCGSGGITAFLILWIAPWLLDLPLPARAFIPFAAVGLIGPLAAFLVICKYSRLARRFFFAPTAGTARSTGVREPDNSSGS